MDESDRMPCGSLYYAKCVNVKDVAAKDLPTKYVIEYVAVKTNIAKHTNVQLTATKRITVYPTTLNLATIMCNALKYVANKLSIAKRIALKHATIDTRIRTAKVFMCFLVKVSLCLLLLACLLYLAKCFKCGGGGGGGGASSSSIGGKALMSGIPCCGGGGGGGGPPGPTGNGLTIFAGGSPGTKIGTLP
uniref:Uncharacterized protein n=1 Tax=Glossina brevipalpis TaxID=37001 RepID=A0A1A9WBE2_9MUSC